MDEIRALPAPDASGGRVETGPVQFGDDWPGVFIRGDNAFGFAMALRDKLAGHDHPLMVEGPLKSLLALLESSSLNNR